MIEQEQELMNLEPVFDENIKGYVVKDYETQKELVVSFIKDLHIGQKIKDDNSYKVIKKKRAKLNKGAKLVSSCRVAVKKLITADIETQLKELEVLLGEASSKVDSKVKEWESEHAEPVVKVATTKTNVKLYQIVISSTDKDIIKEIKDFAKSKKADVSEVK